MTPEELAAIEARAAAATPGPWKVEPDLRPDIYTVHSVSGKGGYFDEGQIIRQSGKEISERTGQIHIAEHAKYENAFYDAEFIAAARTDIPALCAEIRRLHEVINRLG